MRPIKVRGYAIEEMIGSQWLYGTGVFRSDFSKEYAEEIGKESECFLFTDSGWIEVHEESVGQYTGLNDKKGTEIYEKDEVKFKADGLSGRGYVYWNNPLGQWWIQDTRTNVKQRNRGRRYPFYGDASYLVVGNIYEHPHLLKE